MRVFCLLVLLLLLPVVFAQDLVVEKSVKEQEVFSGARATIFLKLTNPFNVSVPVQIVDKNVIGNNGVDIQCLEYEIPGLQYAILQYDPLQPFQNGDYTLDKAKVSYTNPLTHKQTSVESNSLQIAVKKGNSSQSQATGITTIYRCNGQSIQTTSYSSSGSSMNIQVNQNSAQQNSQQSAGQNEAGKQPSGQNQAAQQAVQNNQIPQDSNALKSQMQKQMQANEALKNSLQNNPDFQNLQKEMSRQGFKQTQLSVTPNSTSSGSFEADYQKNNATAKVEGTIANGTIKDVRKSFDEQKKPDYFGYYVLSLFLLAAIGILLYKKYFNKKVLHSDVEGKDDNIDFLSLTRVMIEEAKALWKNKEEKEAYAKVSYAVRFFYMHKHKLLELTSTDLVKFLKSKSLPYSVVQKCLNLCSMVEFAKYKANNEDFREILKLAEDIIKTNK